MLITLFLNNLTYVRTHIKFIFKKRFLELKEKANFIKNKTEIENRIFYFYK